jgi:hypothetical protein
VDIRANAAIETAAIAMDEMILNFMAVFGLLHG